MRVQDISTGSIIGQEDLLFGSMFIEKGRYRNKNFSIKDIINHVRSGVSVEGGRLSIQYATQEENSKYDNVVDLLNRFNGIIIVPANGILLVKMIRNEYGLACDDLYLFTRNDCVLGSEEEQVKDYEFIKLRSETRNRGIEINKSMKLNKGHHKGLIYVDSIEPLELMLPTDLQDDFEVELIQVGPDSVTLKTELPDEEGFQTGLHIGSEQSKIRIVRRPKTKMFYSIQF
jgi:hypothetical protein